MIDKIELKFGRSHNTSQTVILTTPITVFVGPNNSGKSQVLREIHRFCNNGSRNQNDVIIDNIIFNDLSEREVDDKLNKVTLIPHKNETLELDHIIIGKRGIRRKIRLTTLRGALLKPNEHLTQFTNWYLGFNTIILDGRNRINLINEQDAGDLQSVPTSSFQLLFRDDEKRNEVRRIIFDSFGNYLVIDPTKLGILRLKLSKVKPKSVLQERGIHDDAVAFHSSALPIDETSDGVKAFTGMITEIIAGDPQVLLIDEPEAFLHPSLSYKLGKEIALASFESDKRVFVSTHSSNFVMGCIQSGVPVTIVRLTYRNEVATARILPNDDILKLMRNPLLRSTGVLEGLFYEFVIVTESDTDRAFYQEVNDRLLRYEINKGIPNCLFINAQNKQTERIIIKPLRELGIPTSGLVDIDVLKEGGQVWSDFLKSGYVPETSHTSFSQLRVSVKNEFDRTGQEMKRNGGIDLLT